MLTTILLTLLFGIIIGLLWATVFILHFLQIKCPQCKQLKPLQQIFVFTGWKTRTITGQACQTCQRPKKQYEL